MKHEEWSGKMKWLIKARSEGRITPKQYQDACVKLNKARAVKDLTREDIIKTFGDGDK